MPNKWNERGDFSEQLVRIIRLKLRRGEGGLVNGKEKKDGRINRERGWPPFLLTTLFTFLRFSPVHKSPTADHKIVVFAPTGQRCSRPRDESVLGEGRGAQEGATQETQGQWGVRRCDISGRGDPPALLEFESEGFSLILG